jgi:hypothetical protein
MGVTSCMSRAKAASWPLSSRSLKPWLKREYTSARHAWTCVEMHTRHQVGCCCVGFFMCCCCVGCNTAHQKLRQGSMSKAWAVDDRAKMYAQECFLAGQSPLEVTTRRSNLA